MNEYQIDLSWCMVRPESAGEGRRHAQMRHRIARNDSAGMADDDAGKGVPGLRRRFR